MDDVSLIEPDLSWVWNLAAGAGERCEVSAGPAGSSAGRRHFTAQDLLVTRLIAWRK